MTLPVILAQWSRSRIRNRSGALYDPFGPVRGWTWGNGTLAVRTYDLDGKVTQVDSAGLKTYAYDDAFRITGITDTVTPANSYSYGYDSLDRLTSAVKTGTTRGWSYDANGNRLTETGAAASTYTISTTNNRISSISGALPRTYSYDPAGNVLSYATVTATYNNRGRMKTLTKGAVTASYVYNALGQFVKQSGGPSGTVLYVHDEAGHLLGEYTATGALVQETIWLGDVPVATIRPGTPVVVYYVHTDHLNTPRRVTRPSDNKLMWSWYSDPFGADLPNENPASGGTFQYHLRFPGQLYDSHAGLHQNYFRDYDPAIGRYVQSDPIGLKSGVNTFGYVAQNPIWYSDPRGLDIGQDDDNYCWEGVGIPCANKKLPPTERIPPPGPKDPRDKAKGMKPDADICAKASPNAEGCLYCCRRGGLRYGTPWMGACIAECGWYHMACLQPETERRLPRIASVTPVLPPIW